jgi:hypothetical protein
MGGKNKIGKFNIIVLGSEENYLKCLKIIVEILSRIVENKSLK